MCFGGFFFLGEGGFISDMCFLRNKVKRSLWKTFSLSFSQLELCWQSWQDRRGWKFYFHVDFGGEIHRGLSGVCADTEHVLCTLEKKKHTRNVRKYLYENVFKKPLPRPLSDEAVFPLQERYLCVVQAGFVEQRREETEGEKREPLVSINKHNSQAWAHRPPSREHLLWFVEGV